MDALRCEVQNGVGEMSKTIFLDVQVPVYFEVRLRLNPFSHLLTSGGIEQPDSDCEAGRHLGLQCLWRPAHLHRLAQGRNQ